MRKKKKTSSTKNKQIKVTHLLARGTFVLLAFFATIIWLGEKKEPVFIDKSDHIQRTEKEAFIEKIAGKATYLHEQNGILPSISISQAILESNWGTSSLAKQNGNFYGIKGSNSSQVGRFQTKEFLKETEEWIEIDASFRIYDSWEESMEDHTKLLVNGTKWNPDLYKEVVEASSYKEAAYALQKAGYATDPEYPQKLIRLIEQYELAKYDGPSNLTD